MKPRVHYAAPMHGYHEPDEWNPIKCGIEDRANSPKITNNPGQVTCKNCLGHLQVRG